MIRTIPLALVLAAYLISPMADAARYTTVLSGANENPANGSPGTGTAFAELDTTTHVPA